jgi:hypothetical protein
MMQIKDEVFRVDKIVAVLEELTGFILREILDPRGKFYHDGHLVPRESASTS